MNNIGKQFVLDHQLTGPLGLSVTLIGEANIYPSGEQVFVVPLGLTVAKKNERVSHNPSLPISRGYPTEAASGGLW